jgi:hypothetical protein
VKASGDAVAFHLNRTEYVLDEIEQIQPTEEIGPDRAHAVPDMFLLGAHRSSSVRRASVYVIKRTGTVYQNDANRTKEI